MERENTHEQSEPAPEAQPTPVKRVVFERRMLLSPFLYRIYEDEKDREMIERWKTEINKIIDETKMQLSGEKVGPKKNALLLRALGENPSEEDIVLFSISRFVQTNRSKGTCFIPKSFRKFMKGGDHTLSELGKDFDTCIDTAVLTQILAEEYGFKGTLETKGHFGHSYWQRTDGNHEIIDAYWLQDRGGFLKDPEAYDIVLRKEP